jgi:serine/threonine protein kinase
MTEVVNDYASAAAARPEKARRGGAAGRHQLDRPRAFSLLSSDRYRINSKKLLGKGSYSFVYEANDITNGNVVVAKVTNLAEKTHIRCHRQEILTFKRLGRGNEHIVKFYGDFIEDKCGVIVLEKLSSFTLEDYIYERGRMDFITGLSVFSQILSAVEAMHKVDISPRDLKAENIAFDLNTRNVKLFDFGLSAIIEPNAKGEIPLIKSTTGSPLYMAPEVLAMKPHNSFVHDIWCLGQILYTMLVGNCPFSMCTNLDDLKEEVLIYKKIAFPSWIEYKANKLLHGMLEWDPALRMTLDEVRKTVDGLLAAENDF